MKRVAFLMFAIVLISGSLFAQGRSVDVLGNVTWVDLSGEDVLKGGTNLDNLRVNFKSDVGYGAAINVFWSNRISTEFAASVVEPEVNIQPNGETVVPADFVGDMQMIPITATLQFHLAPEATIDPYIGAGAAYVLFDDVHNGADFQGASFDRLNVKDDVGLVLNGGLTYRFSRVFALNADAKYVPIKSSARAVFATGPGESSDIEVNPLMLSAGLRLMF